jgi:hypothetical protein
LIDGSDSGRDGSKTAEVCREDADAVFEPEALDGIGADRD